MEKFFTILLIGVIVFIIKKYRRKAGSDEDEEFEAGLSGMKEKDYD